MNSLKIMALKKSESVRVVQNWYSLLFD